MIKYKVKMADVRGLVRSVVLERDHRVNTDNLMGEIVSHKWVGSTDDSNAVNMANIVEIVSIAEVD